MPTRHFRNRPASRRVRRACAMFGTTPEVVSRTPVEGCGSAAAELDRVLKPGQSALVSGPSGSGKSTILRLLGEDLARRGRMVVRPPVVFAPGRAVVDQFRRPLPMTLRLLARAGLAEAAVFALMPEQLSEGQRWRLSLALAMATAEEAEPAAQPTLIVDEFASSLDRLSARCLSRALGKWVGASRVRAVCATAHDDLLIHLRPAVLVRQPLSAPAEVVHIAEDAL